MSTAVSLSGKLGFILAYWSPPDPRIIFEAQFKNTWDALVMLNFTKYYTSVRAGESMTIVCQVACSSLKLKVGQQTLFDRAVPPYAHQYTRSVKAYMQSCIRSQPRLNR